MRQLSPHSILIVGGHVTAIPGIEGVNLADIHGQFRFNFRHAAISRDHSKTMLDRAFHRDYEVNSPSLFRLTANMLAGWRRNWRG